MVKFLLKRSLARIASFFHPKEDVPIYCIAMVRNEVDLIGVWVRHLLSTFDNVIIYDHMSDDGTFQELSQCAISCDRLEVRRYLNPAYDQSGLMTKAFFELRDTKKSGWVFFLDADEFVVIRGRSSLSKLLRKYRAAKSISLKWCNVYPESNDSISDNSEVKGWTSGPVYIPKVAVNLKYADNVASISQGNHSVYMKKKSVLSKFPILQILHVPIRTRNQLISKLRIGIRSNNLLENGNSFAQHWVEMSNQENWNGIRHAVYNYGIADPSRKISEKNIPREDISGRLHDYCVFEVSPKN